jgi:hypothetical protein
MTTSTPLTIRFAQSGDAVALGALAQLDSAPVPAAPVLVAETAGNLLAALSLSDGASVADPFRHTANVLELLRIRAAGAEADGAPARRAEHLAVSRAAA